MEQDNDLNDVFTEACNYLLVYEYVISAEIEGDTWAGMKRAIATRGFPGSQASASSSPGGRTEANRTLLLGGRKDGHICVFNWENGQVEFEIEVILTHWQVEFEIELLLRERVIEV